MSSTTEVLTLTHATLADRLNANNMQYEDLIRGPGYKDFKENCVLAKNNGLVIIRGYSDDGVCFEGAINDQIGAYNGTEFLIDHEGPLSDYDDCDTEEMMQDYMARKENAHKVKAVWCGKATDFAWTFETDLPHSTFVVSEDGENWCRGIVVSVNDLMPKLVATIPDEIADAIIREKSRYESTIAELLECVRGKEPITINTGTFEMELSDDQAKAYRSGVAAAIELLGMKFPFDMQEAS